MSDYALEICYQRCPAGSTQSLLLFVFVVFAFGLISTSHNYIDLYTVKLVIENNEIQKVKGCIANHKVNQNYSRTEGFSISDILFKYNDYGTAGYFFANRQHDNHYKKWSLCNYCIYTKQFK